MEINLFNAQQAHSTMSDLWIKIKPYLLSGRQFKLTIKPMTRSIPQNAMFHAIIGQIAKQAEHMGATYDSEDWKRILIWQWAKDTSKEQGKLVPSLDGTGIVQLGLQSRNFTKDEASEFTEWLLMWCATHGIDNVEPTHE
jgi:NinB protein